MSSETELSDSNCLSCNWMDVLIVIDSCLTVPIQILWVLEDTVPIIKQ